jgi:alpha-galactosidase
MVDEMLVAQAQWLPQYRKAIAGARSRLAAVKRSGDYRGTRRTEGAARLKTASVADMKKRAAEHRRMAAASDKGNLAKSGK